MKPSIHEKYSPFRGITRNILILGLVSLFTDLSSQMVFPLIPLFLTTIMGSGAYAVGIVEGAAETTASLLKAVSGYWSDRMRKRKPFVISGYSLSSLAKPLFALATTWSFVLYIRVLERIGKGLRTAPRDALVAESCDESVRGRAYGFHRAMDGIGSVLGAVFAFVLLPVLGYRNIFLFALLPGILAVGILLFVKEKNTPVHYYQKAQPAAVNFRELPKNLQVFIITASFFALGHFGYAFLLLRAKNIGIADHRAILLYALFYIVYTVCAVPFGIISDNVGRKPVLLAGYTVFALLSLVLIYTSNAPALLLSFVVYGIFYAMIDGTQRAFVVDLAPGHLKATALGTYHAAIGLVALPGGFIAGILWDTIRPEFTFLYGFILTTISIVLFTFVKDTRKAIH